MRLKLRSLFLLLGFVFALPPAALVLAPPRAATAQERFVQTLAVLVGADGLRHPLTVEFASTPQQLQQGLMFRRSMAVDSGMLFDFGHDQPVSMWMKNTLIPLDMLFLDRAGRVVGIAERAVPETTTVISSPGPVRAVLEVNGGTTARLGLKVGDRVEHQMFTTGAAP